MEETADRSRNMLVSSVVVNNEGLLPQTSMSAHAAV